MDKKKCLECGMSIEGYGKRQNKFCGRSCSARYNNKRRKHSQLTKDKISKSLQKHNEGIEPVEHIVNCKFCKKDFLADKPRRKYCSNDCRLSGQGKKKRNKLSCRTFQKILRRAFPDWECPFCDWKKTFRTHHIKHRSKNGDEDTMNLVMLCPNHHSEAHLPDGHEEKEITDCDLREHVVGHWYTGDELMEKFYYGSVAKEFEKVK